MEIMHSIPNDATLPIIHISIRDLHLTEAHKNVLKALFTNHSEVYVTGSLKGGYGGCYILWIEPFSYDGFNAKKRKKLATIVKLGPRDLIEQETYAYQNHIAGYLPLSIPVIKAYIPNIPETEQDQDGDHKEDYLVAGIQYHLAGEGIFKFVDLLEYFKTNEISAIKTLLETQLFKAIKELYNQYERGQGALLLRASCERYLDVNFTIDLGISVSKIPVELTPRQVLNTTIYEHRTLDYGIGNSVRLNDFVISKLEHKERSVIVNLTVQEPLDRPAESFRIRVLSVDDMHKLRIGDTIPQWHGQIVQERMKTLQSQVVQLLGQENIKENDQFILLSDGTKLPNPVVRLNDYLGHHFFIPVIGKIHGDLNLHNVLICLDNQTLNFIDFATARVDHLFHDYLRLETEVIVKLIPQVFSSTSDLFMHSFYTSLHDVWARGDSSLSVSGKDNSELQKCIRILQLIRKEVQTYFSNADEWQDYYRCLVICLLGILKYQTSFNESTQKSVIIGAATLIDIIEKNKPAETSIPIPPLPIPWGAFSPKIMQEQRQRKLGDIAIVPIKSGSTVKIEVLGADKGFHPVEITADSNKQILVYASGGWSPGAKPQPIQGTQPLTWPNKDHTWKFTRLDLKQGFSYEIEGSVREESFDQNIIAAAWWIEHTAKNKPTEKFLILVGH